MVTWLAKWGAKKGLQMVAPKIAKNLKSRRETFETMVKAVDKQYKKSGLKITDKGKKIKRDAALKGSKIYDRYEKLQKILDKRAKNVKETKTLLKAAGATATAGAGAAGVSLYNKKKKKD